MRKLSEVLRGCGFFEGVEGGERGEGDGDGVREEDSRT